MSEELMTYDEAIRRLNVKMGRKGGKARWKGVSKEQRVEYMRAVRALRMDKSAVKLTKAERAKHRAIVRSFKKKDA